MTNLFLSVQSPEGSRVCKLITWQIRKVLLNIHFTTNFTIRFTINFTTNFSIQFTIHFTTYFTIHITVNFNFLKAKLW